MASCVTIACATILVTANTPTCGQTTTQCLLTSTLSPQACFDAQLFGRDKTPVHDGNTTVWIASQYAKPPDDYNKKVNSQDRFYTNNSNNSNKTNYQQNTPAWRTPAWRKPPLVKQKKAHNRTKHHTRCNSSGR
jgi:hypothetical protein